MAGISQTSAPANEPITTAEAKTHLRIEHSNDDTYIDGLIEAARIYVERFLGRQLITATWKYTRRGFPATRRFPLPRPPLVSITSLKYLDVDGDEQTVSSGDYAVHVDTLPGFIELDQGESWPTTYGDSGDVRATFVAGYGGQTSVPMPIKQAMMILIAHWYDLGRQPQIAGAPVASVATTVDALLWQYRYLEFAGCG